MTIKKTFTTAVVAASLFGGTLLAIPLLASAQDSSPSLETNSGQETEKGEEIKVDRHSRAIEVLLDLGLDPADVREGFANGQTLGDTAEANGISADAVVDAITASMTERLNQALADGKITAEEAAEKAAGIPEKATEIVNSIPDRKDKDRGHRKGAFLGEVLLDLGLDPADVREGFANGQTLGDTAEANGISADAVVDAITASMTERLNQALADGKITAEEAAEKAAGIPEKATEIVNSIPDRNGDQRQHPNEAKKQQKRDSEI